MKWQFILGIALVFLSGAAIGGAFTAYGIREGIREVQHDRPGRMGGRFAHRLQEKLDLTAEQNEKVKTIMDKTRGELDALRDQTFPRAREIMKRGGDEIATILNAEQQQKFEKFRARMAQKMERRARSGRGRWHGEFRRGDEESDGAYDRQESSSSVGDGKEEIQAVP